MTIPTRGAALDERRAVVRHPSPSESMFVIAKHEISDPVQVRAIIAAAELPAGLTLHQVFTNPAGTKQVCLWEADSVEDVSSFVDPALAGVSSNTYFAVEEASALGLPVSAG